MTPQPPSENSDDTQYDQPDDPHSGHSDDPHSNQPIVTGGAPAMAAETAVILIHVRGGTAEGTIRLADEFYRHGVACIAPQATRSRWYPYGFDEPLSRNEPWLTSAVDRVGEALNTDRRRRACGARD